MLIVKGGDFFVESSIAIAKKTKIPSVIIGATLVSVATTLPELLVTTIASAKGSFDLAVGNAVGTIICNAALILGIGFILIPGNTDKKQYSKKIGYLVFVNFILFVFALNYNIAWWEALILFLIFCGFFAMNIFEAKTNLNPTPNTKEESFVLWKILLMFVIGAFGIGVGAYLLVEYGSMLASILGVSEYIIGIVFVALGTSLPELVTCLQSIKKKNSGLTIGNIIGANIINCSLLIGISGLFSGQNGLSLSAKTLWFSLPIMIFSTFIIALPIVFKGKTYRIQGILLLTLYISYIFALIAF